MTKYTQDPREQSGWRKTRICPNLSLLVLGLLESCVLNFKELYYHGYVTSNQLDRDVISTPYGYRMGINFFFCYYLIAHCIMPNNQIHMLVNHL